MGKFFPTFPDNTLNRTQNLPIDSALKLLTAWRLFLSLAASGTSHILDVPGRKESESWIPWTTLYCNLMIQNNNCTLKRLVRQVHSKLTLLYMLKALSTSIIWGVLSGLGPYSVQKTLCRHAANMGSNQPLVYYWTLILWRLVFELVNFKILQN